MRLGRFVCSLLIALPATVAVATPLDDRIGAFTDPSATQNEAGVLAVLKAGADEKRSAEALAAVQGWLNRNALTRPDALLLAGQSADVSGQWLSAVGYYQRLLQLPKPNAKQAGVAVDSVYRLLTSALADENAAYLYMVKDGNRVRAYGNAKRYDRWFLDQAKRRNALPAVAERLAVIAGDRSTDLKRFDQDFAWLCAQFEQFRKQDPSVYAAASKLAAEARTPALYKARLSWYATVMPYNHKLDELRKDNTPADPKLTDAPMAAAAQLIKTAPDLGPMLVVKGWGIEYDGHHGTCAARFQVEGQRKLAQLLAAVPKMSPGKRDDLLAYPIARGRIKFDVLDIWALVVKHPESFNRFEVERVPLFDKAKLTVEKAKQLAPHLARNPHPEAAMIRAIAISGSLEVSKITEAMAKTEAWRFEKSKDLVGTAWNASTTQDVSNKQLQKQYAKADARLTQLKNQIDKKAPSAQRIAAFNALYTDLIADTPTLPAGPVLWDELFSKAPDADLVQMIKVMVADTSGRRGLLLKKALPNARFGKKRSGSMHWQGEVYSNQFRYHRKPVQDAVPDLIAHLQGMIAKQLQSGRIDPMVFGMWLHTVNPKQDDAVALIKKVVSSPAYGKLDPSYHASVADGNHFGMSMATPAIVKAQPQYTSRELLALPKDAKPAAVEAAFNAVMKRVASLPEPVIVYGLEPVAALPKWSEQTRRNVLSLFRDYAPLSAYPKKQGYEPLIERLADDARVKKQWHLLESYLVGIWRAAGANDHHRPEGAPRLVKLAEAALEAEQMSVAMSMARNGLASRLGQSLSNSNDESNKQLAGRLAQVQGKAAIAIGIIDIPVDERDPAYPIYKSQAEFAIGNTAAAWELYDEHAEKLVPLARKLTVPYCLWVLQRDLEAEESQRAEALIRELTVWSREAAGTFTPDQDAELKIAYADAAYQKGALQTAKAWYRRVADASEFKGTRLQYKALLRSVRVDRALKDYTGAMTELDKLMQIRDEDLRIKVHFARAEVLFDQENYVDSFAEVSTVLKRDPGHADALILLGKAQLEMRKLVDASEIELGVTQDQKVIVPGELIKINLTDPALNISGVTADIEVEIWTKSGDRETVMLYQLGDDKTRFRAEVPTKLGLRSPGDKKLQVLGRDEIRYGFSKAFREKMKDLPADPDIVITVASDARLVASAGAFPAREGERKLDLEELGVSTAQQALGTRRVRPGNPVYLRVTDPDQGKTDAIDQIVVSLETSSGDIIPRLVLKETDTHSGEFQASVPTGPAQAIAYASESAPGRDANMIISKEAYPGWSGELGSKAEDQLLTIDLNDNVPFDTMMIGCTDPAQALTHFVVQTSVNGRDWTTRARFPQGPAPWDGRPQLTAFGTYGPRAIAITEATDHSVPQDWRHKMEITSATPGKSYSAHTVQGIGALTGLNDLASGGHPGYSVLVRYRAMFYQPAAAIRTFQVSGLPNGEKVSTRFLINGKHAGKNSDDALTITRELKPGLHTIEIWRHESRGDLIKRKPVILCDQAGKDELVPCTAEMFDPSTFPAPMRELVPAATTVKLSEQDKNQFEIAFGARTRGRMVRLAIVGHKGAAPAIHKVTLTDREGVKRLPVETDYQKLRENGKLEVVPGDTVSVRYIDDLVVSKRKTNQQARLSVAYNTATITAAFINYVTTEEGRERLVEPIRRFKMEGNADKDDSIGVVIVDPDMDQSPKRDRVRFTVKSSGGATKELEALETGPHTGEFERMVFPALNNARDDAGIVVPKGGTLIFSYRDQENLDPGIPTDRTATVEHALYKAPKLGVYTTNTAAMPQPEQDQADEPDKDDRGPEVVKPRRSIDFAYLNGSTLENQTPVALIGSSLRFDVVVPHLAFANSSEIFAFVQTDSGREADKANISKTMAFDVRVPGTLRLVANPSRSASVVTPAGYEIGSGAGSPTSRPPLDEGRFAFTVPIALDDTPTRSYGTKDAMTLPSSMVPKALAVRPGDRVHIGFAYFDDNKKLQWLTATTKLGSHAFLDVMNSRYRTDITSAFVGEKLYVRLIAPELDRGAGRDATRVMLKADSGATVEYELLESEPHSGVFKGSFALGYADKPTTGKLPSVTLHGLPVKYGDTVRVSYPGSGPDAPPARSVTINKGADGGIEPFSKRFGDDTVAVETSFTLAECYFELAKHHRKMEQESLARREIGQARKLLAEAVQSHTDDEMKAHALYLLGNLDQEYADLSKNQKYKKEKYQAALARFSKIPLDYPDTEFAPKAQFKKALVYERLGELDTAVEEYVKLAYKYPDSELIPVVMSRLGGYFQSQGLAHKKQAEALDAEEGNADAQGEAIKQRELATKEYLNAAAVFKKLEARFPSHELAGLAGLRSAQNFMRAGDYEAAITGFKKVYDTEEYDDKKIRSQAMYWSAISQEKLEDITQAYQLYRRITFDFPDSIWAKRSRGRLIDPTFEKLIEAEKKERELLIEGIKENQRRR